MGKRGAKKRARRFETGAGERRARRKKIHLTKRLRGSFWKNDRCGQILDTKNRRRGRFFDGYDGLHCDLQDG